MQKPVLGGYSRVGRIFLAVLLGIGGGFVHPSYAQDDLVGWINYTVEDGLPSMDVYDLMQDKKGFIWLATSAGLCRYDGYRFQTFTTRDGLPGNDIIELEEDAKGRIWISSLGPLCYYEDEHFHLVDTGGAYNHALSGFNLVGLDDGYVWMNIGTELKLMTPSRVFEKLSINYLVGATFARNRIFPISGQVVGIAARDSIFLVKHNQVISRFPTNCPIIANRDFAALYYRDNIYYTSSCGLMRYDLRNACQSLVDPSMKIGVRMSIIDKELWVLGGGPGGSQVYHTSRWFFGACPDRLQTTVCKQHNQRHRRKLLVLNGWEGRVF